MTMVVAQRLVRKICDQCKESYEVNTAWLTTVGVPQKKLPDHAQDHALPRQGLRELREHGLSRPRASTKSWR